MPSVTVKAFAALIHTPLYQQLRILHDHKYPRNAPAAFKIMYYQPALRMIHRFYGSSNDSSKLAASAADINGVGKQAHQRDHNFRAITAFCSGKQFGRAITPHKSPTWEIVRPNFSIRCTPDHYFTENGQTGVAMMDCREQAPDDEFIRTTLELLHIAVNENGLTLPMRCLEYIHLESDQVHSWSAPRKATGRRLDETVSAIARLWETI
jgi:hypothetical protein